ncbi:MAG: dihydroorotate dehydrogenase B (NAD(+)), electron transfer subunit [Candidatus Hydrogenedentota bacterium]
MKRYLLDCPVLNNDEVAAGQFRMRLHGPEIAGNAIAGQFCMLQVAEGLYPFLRRPMCFERIFEDSFNILYKVEGEGTRLLSRMVPGQTVHVQGPLGNGFTLDGGFARHIIVAGGIGVATFPALAEAIIKTLGVTPEVIIAARTKDFILCDEDFRAMGCKVHIATDDGSAGEKMFASQMLLKLAPGPDSRVYACGPMVMMKTTADAAVSRGADCHLSLEAQMACGDGACLGCVVESTRETEGEKMVRVCLDGPVFDTRLIDWKSHNYAAGV